MPGGWVVGFRTWNPWALGASLAAPALGTPSFHPASLIFKRRLLALWALISAWSRLIFPTR